MAARFDVIVIGAGQAGVPLAFKFAKRGKRVALCDRADPGGSCLNHGCIPSKALLASAHAAQAARDATKLGVSCAVDVDFPRVMSRLREVRDRKVEGLATSIAESDIEWFAGEASFTESGAIRIDGRTIEADTIVVDTGSQARIPDIDGLATLRESMPERILTDRELFELETLPGRLAVLGGGVIGVEIGQAFARLGSDVTMIEHADRLLSKESAAVSGIVTAALRNDGIDVRLATRIRRVRSEGRAIRLQSEDGGEIVADAVLLATGRTPNTTALAPERAGVTLDDRGTIVIDDRFRTSRDGVFAVGDVAGQPKFTHVAWEDHLRLESVLEGGDRRRDDRALAYAIFCSPEVGRAGRAGDDDGDDDVRVERRGADRIQRMQTDAVEDGFLELVADRSSGTLVGATVVGPTASETVQVLVPLIESKVTWRDLDRAVLIHPTYAENLRSVARAFAG